MAKIAPRTKAQITRLVQLHGLAREVASVTSRALKTSKPADYPALRQQLARLTDLTLVLEMDDVTRSTP